MIALLISILMTLGINFTALDNGKIQVSNEDAIELKSSELYQKSNIDGSIDEVVITSGVDPIATETSRD